MDIVHSGVLVICALVKKQRGPDRKCLGPLGKLKYGQQVLDNRECAITDMILIVLFLVSEAQYMLVFSFHACFRSNSKVIQL